MTSDDPKTVLKRSPTCPASNDAGVRPGRVKAASPSAHTGRALLAWAILLFFTAGAVRAAGPVETDYTRCLSCHRGIERLDARHDFECAACHLLPGDRSGEALSRHDVIIRNPSDPVHMTAFCLACHEKEIRAFRNSLHATLAGVINQTRFLWGAQATAAPARFGLSGPFRPLPDIDPGVYPDHTAALVDDFLRRKCLRCHVHTSGCGGRGLYRAAGCAACHVRYADDGRYRGKDAAIDPARAGYPVSHVFTRAVPDTQCRHCHNHNHVGADYAGLFEHDFSDTYRSPLAEGRTGPLIYGLDQHHLSADLHAERGLWCIDCHEKRDVMGNGRAYSYEMEVPKRTCSACHGGFGGALPDPSVAAIRREVPPSRPKGSPSGLSRGKGENRVFVFVSKNGGRHHLLPVFSRRGAAHRVAEHAKVRCSACHAQWSYQDYGLSVIRRDRLDAAVWRRLTIQGDPCLTAALESALERRFPQYPVSMDWISGGKRPGVWLTGWRFRRWEFMPLGKDDGNRYAVLRPLYQYAVTYVDRLGNIPLDGVVPVRRTGGRGWAYMPYVPHTTAPAGRPCDACHRNRIAAGLGIQRELTEDTLLTVPSPPAVRSMRLLNNEERRRLLVPSKRYGKARFRALTGIRGMRE